MQHLIRLSNRCPGLCAILIPSKLLYCPHFMQYTPLSGNILSRSVQYEGFFSLSTVLLTLLFRIFQRKKSSIIQTFQPNCTKAMIFARSCLSMPHFHDSTLFIFVCFLHRAVPEKENAPPSSWRGMIFASFSNTDCSASVFHLTNFAWYEMNNLFFRVYFVYFCLFLN